MNKSHPWYRVMRLPSWSPVYDELWRAHEQEEMVDWLLFIDGERTNKIKRMSKPMWFDQWNDRGLWDGR